MTSPNAASVHAQFDRILDTLGEKRPRVAEHLDAARADVLAFTVFPKEVWRQIWSTNPVRHEAPCDRAEMEGLRCRVVAAA
jgi:transposase-like protein